MGKIHDFSFHRLVMLFFLFFRWRFWFCHLTPLSRSLLRYCIHYSDALRDVYLCVPTAQDSANIPKLGGINTRRDGIFF